MKFDPNEYETVKQRKKRFYEDNPDGRIEVINVTPQDQLLEFSLFQAKVYKDKKNHELGLPTGTGYALEIRDKDKSLNKYGKEYESVNYTSWTENCEESAVGRALDNAGYSGNNKCSREEMEKAQRMSKINAVEQATDMLIKDIQKTKDNAELDLLTGRIEKARKNIKDVALRGKLDKVVEDKAGEFAAEIDKELDKQFTKNMDF